MVDIMVDPEIITPYGAAAQKGLENNIFVIVIVTVTAMVVFTAFISSVPLFPQICDKAGCKKGQVECGRCHGKKKVSVQIMSWEG